MYISHTHTHTYIYLVYEENKWLQSEGFDRREQWIRYHSSAIVLHRVAKVGDRGGAMPCRPSSSTVRIGIPS